MGREQNRAMLHALTWRIRAIPENRRPKLLVFGESWGPHHAGCLHEGTRGFDRAGVDRALFIGTPPPVGGPSGGGRTNRRPTRMDVSSRWPATRSTRRFGVGEEICPHLPGPAITKIRS